MNGSVPIVCPHCGEKNQAGRRLCWTCQRTLTVDPPQNPVATPSKNQADLPVSRAPGRRHPFRRVALLGLLTLVVIGGLFAFQYFPYSGQVKINHKDGAEMVWVPAGEFIMGSTDSQTSDALKGMPVTTGDEEESRKPWLFILEAEKPQRKVHLDGYWMYKQEVTVAQYRKFCEATKREMPKPPEWGWIYDHPIVNVTWYDACDYAKWAGVSLPTEAQWEKAARGMDGRIYPWGNGWNSSLCANSLKDRLQRTQPGGYYPTDESPYGAMDMAGNVREWCADWYDPNYYKNAPARNPAGPSDVAKRVSVSRRTISGDRVTDDGGRVLRGGAWDNDYYDYFRYDDYRTDLRDRNDFLEMYGGHGPTTFDDGYDYFYCAYRNYRTPTYRSSNCGFRCVKIP